MRNSEELKEEEKTKLSNILSENEKLNKKNLKLINSESKKPYAHFLY